MDDNLKTSLWQQFGATIDYLDSAMSACPDHLWQARLWQYPAEKPEFSHVWYVAYHTLFWLDIYLTGSEEGFAPPAPFGLIEMHEDGPVPETPYTKSELQGYLRTCREKCRATIAALTDETAGRRCKFGWGELSFLELLFYNMRHVQEHAAQINLLIGQTVGSPPDYAPRLGDESATCAGC